MSELASVLRIARAAPQRRTVIRSLAASVGLLAPCCVTVALDWALRGSRMERFSAADWRSYVASVFESGVVWAVLLLVSHRGRPLARAVGCVSFLLAFAVSLGGQAYFFEQYGAYLNVGVSRFATNFRESVANQLLADAGNYLSFKGPALLVGAALWWGCGYLLGQKPRTLRRSSRFGVLLIGLALAGALSIPTQATRRQASTPDMLYLNAMGELLVTQLGWSEASHKQHPGLRRPMTVPAIDARPQLPRNVVLILLESVRLDATCNEFDPSCKKTPATNALFPNRIALSQMRALDSCTAVSMAVLYSGLGPHESRKTLQSWPFLFDYAKKAGYVSAYFTSQNILFGNMRLWLRHLGVDHFFSALDVDPESDIDMGAPEQQFSQVARARLEQLKEPFFLTVQLSNGHYPYFVDPGGPTPFQPATTSKAPEDTAQFFNHYQNAVYQQDQHLADLLAAIRRLPSGPRTVIVTTSDHGEAFREHDQMGHTLSVFDEELRVPAWVDAPEGTLTREERAALLEARDEPVVHPDVTATVLDLLGIWDRPQLGRFKKRMVGRSLLRVPRPGERVVPLSNCAGVWTCAFENWGVMRGSMKLHAREWDSDFRCFNVAVDPMERVDLGVSACGDLEAHALSYFGRLPGKKQ